MFAGAFFVFLVASALFLVKIIYEKTEVVPVRGGSYTEGVAGQPSFINPVLAVGDADRDLTEIAFANLADLAESYKNDTNGKIWHYRLKDGLEWQDGEKITSDDIIFTIEAIQNPNVFSPLAPSWQGVGITRVSEKEVEITLPGPYVFFQSVLEDLRPIPKHLFAKIPAANMRISNYNFEPVGSGPYKFITLSKNNDGFINSYSFERNENYSGVKPYLERLNFSFFSQKDDLIRAFNRGDIDGFGLGNAKDDAQLIFPHKIFTLKTSKYYAVFFNAYAQPIFQDKNVRRAMNLAVNKQEIIAQVFQGEATAIGGPLVGPNEIDSPSEYSPDKASALLDESGWQLGSEGVRARGDSRLEFTLIVPDIDFLKKTAASLQMDWQKIGVKVNIQTASLNEISDSNIKTRDYQMLIFGNVVGREPDLFSFWHSSEKFYPGLNLALYENKLADNLIETVRKDFEEEKRQNDLAELQSVIIAETPAIFLYSPNYFYAAKKDLSGFDERSDNYLSSPNDRLQNINKWYIKTARTFK